MRNNRGIRTAQRKGELWDLDAVGPRGMGTRMLISPFSCSPTDHRVLLGHRLRKNTAAGKGWCCALLPPTAPLWGVGCQGHLLRLDFQLGMCWGTPLDEGWLQTSPPWPRRRHKPWRQTLGEHSRCRGRSFPSGLQLCKYPRRSVQKCSLMQFRRAWVLLQQVSLGHVPWPGGHSPPTPPKTLETCRFFVVCMWVKTGKQYRPKKDKCPGLEGGEEAAGISSEMLC